MFCIVNVVNYPISFHFNGNILTLQSGAFLEIDSLGELDEDLVEYIHDELIIIDLIEKLNDDIIEWTKEGF